MNFLKNRTTVGIVCIVLSLIICFCVTPLFNAGMSQKTDVIRVAKEIKAGTEITKDMVQTAEVGSFNLPENAVRDKETVIGKYVTADLSVGDYILTPKLTDVPAAENAYLYSLNGEKQAMSVTVKFFAGGLSSKLQSGDRENSAKFIAIQEQVNNALSVPAPSESKGGTRGGNWFPPVRQTVSGANLYLPQKIRLPWSSPGSGKTVTAVKLAQHLASKKQNVVLVLCDMTTPMLPCICPPGELEGDHSLGSILVGNAITETLVKHNCNTHKRMGHLAVIGLCKGENENSYPDVTLEVSAQVLAGNLFADLSLKDSRGFRKEIEKISKEVFNI